MKSIQRLDDIDLLQLRTFLALADTRHFGEAAKQLNTTQSAVSKRIASLEDRLSILLFDRDGRGVRMTSAGNYLYRNIPAILDELDECLRSTVRAASGKSGLLRIGYSAVALPVFLASGLRRVKVEYPDLEICLLEGNTAELIEMINGDRLDLAFALRPVDGDPNLCSFKVVSAPIGIVVPPDHPLSRSDYVTLEMLRSEPLILFPRTINPILYDEILKACHQAGFTPRIEREVSPREAAIALVAAGNGITFLTSQLRHLAIGGVVFRSLSGPTPTLHIFCVYRLIRANQIEVLARCLTSGCV